MEEKKKGEKGKLKNADYSALRDKNIDHLRNFTRIGVALSSAASLEEIFDLILQEAIAFTNADGATIYRVSEGKKALEFVVVYNRALKLHMGGLKNPITWTQIPLFDNEGKPNLKHIAAYVYHTGKALNFEDVYLTVDYGISGTKAIDAENNYRTKSMLTLPLKSHEEEVLGILQVINAMNDKGEIVAFDDEQKFMLESLASLAAIAMTNRKLINDLEALLFQFMQAFVKGIELKSAYSSNHITRVAFLTDMIAKKINAVEKGKFSRVKFNSDELQELTMAGLMHDAGKIITPEHLINKATKLESVTDRIDLVNLRFKLFKQVLQLYKLVEGEEKLLKEATKWYPEKPPSDAAELFDNLEKDRQFLEKVNYGAEYLSDASVERITAIGKISLNWKGETWTLLTPEEAHNLQIRGGTLTAQERQIVDEHANITWEMLSKLKFPSKYKNVPLYAASHHEKLNGSGHPFGLKADQIPIQSRIIAVADLFEALSSPERPYKKSNSLGETLKIMAQSAKKNEIDADILDLILDSGLYLEFAQRLMKSEQIDKVEISEIKKIYHEDKID
ncbi:MAG TPA: HD domain-containing phosphohydrolase [Candidatus Cloacimonadota bacterium]|nr:HD domain-containing phosphohydrolase [Candidatus Cloacimonadota bacterium]